MAHARRVLLMSAALAALAATGHRAVATSYIDSKGNDFWGNYENDITSCVVSNDSSSITFRVNFNPAANFTNNYYANLEMGIQIGNGAGGQTAINGTYGVGDPAAGNPWGQSVGISTGMNFFAGIFPDGPTWPGGSQLYQYSATSGWAQVGATGSIVEAPSGSTPSIKFSFPLSSLGLAVGDSFKFDIWSTYSNANSAYDALDNPYSPFFGTTETPYPNNGNPPGNYDSASTLSKGSYTLIAPRVAGDANGDGKINGDDYALIDRGYNRMLSGLLAPGAADWTDGDFNGDGVIDSADYLILDQAFAQSASLSPTLLAERESQFGPGYVSSLLASVPEPSAVAFLLVPLLVCRRRARGAAGGCT